ncbi:NADH-cytochrome b5 reductase-like isoform X2 [Dreissena polymorpha]|nr:NADH-cytochrome b5 reductase-like isoform X2 [Dreissena polymorpha]XP_052256710.1 NADH-cytochrome b5 reductase-like isoform X2 [Dreissena polymorpha]
MTSGLPLPPEKPLESDCCGQGCVPCVKEIYEENLIIWQNECEKIHLKPQEVVNNLPSEVNEPLLDLLEYRLFTIKHIEDEPDGCKRYQFQLPTGRSLGLKTGQHIIIRAHIDGSTVTRQYTPVSDVEQKSSFELLIKVYNRGKMSQFVRLWTIGTSVDIRGPCGSYNYIPNQYRVLYMFAIGTGIAPMSQVINTILNNEEDETVIRLHYGCRCYGDILLKSRIDDWSRYWNFTCTYYLSQEDTYTSNKAYRYGDKIVKNKIDELSVRSAMINFTSDSFVLICGTHAFTADMLDFLSAINILKGNIHKF